MQRILNRAAAAALLAALLAAGCSGSAAKVRGRIVENGQPLAFEPTTAAVELSLLKEDGKPDPAKLYTAVVNEDGTFEVVASGGEIPPGKYRVTIQARGKHKARLKGFAPESSNVTREVTAGGNNLTLDAAKPAG